MRNVPDSLVHGIGKRLRGRPAALVRRLARSAQAIAPAEGPGAPGAGRSARQTRAGGAQGGAGGPQVDPSWTRLVAEGHGATGATVTAVRHLVDSGRGNEAVSVGYALLADPATAQLGSLVLGICRRQSSDPELAWRDLSQVHDLDLVAAGGDDWFVPAFRLDTPRAAEALAQVIEQGRHQEWGGAVLVRVARAAFINGELDLTRTLIADGRARTDGPHAVTAYLRKELSRLSTWLPEGSHRAPVPPLPADVRLGILNYHQPDVSSRNVGDWIQTLAAVGHIVRHRNLSFVGDDEELVSFISGLAGQVRPARRLDRAPGTTVQLVEVQRDAMPYQDLPDPTWVLAFGWYMHPTFEQDFGFPFPSSVRPIFISFHLNKPDMLTDGAIDYLRRYGPVGCRDWQTVIALRGVGVPAFFSGCMTTTVDTVIPEGDPAERTHVGYVDHPREGEGEVIEQTITNLRGRSFADNLELARSWVQGYASRYRKVYTSRLHCNLPARSVGCEVEFHPKNRSDVRFGGLIDTDDAAFEAIRQGILDKLRGVLELILDGAPEVEVYARWRELCAPAMEEADRYLDSLDWDLGPAPVLPQLHDDIERAVVVDLGPGEAEHLPGFLRQLARRVPSGTAVVVSGDETLRVPTDEAGLSREVGLPVAYVNRSTLSLDGASGRLPGPKESGQWREVLLAAALGTVASASRVLVLPAAALLREDLGPLFDIDLQGHPVAAPRDPRRTRRLASALARGVSSRQGKDAAAAMAFLGGASRTLAPRAVPFDPVVLVVDPAALGAAGGAKLLPLMTAYRASFREALNVLLGDRCAELPERWASMAHLQTPAPDAAVVTYRVGTRPWSGQVTAGVEEWAEQQG